jgi:Cytidylyltransferase-like
MIDSSPTPGLIPNFWRLPLPAHALQRLIQPIHSIRWPAASLSVKIPGISHVSAQSKSQSFAHCRSSSESAVEVGRRKIVNVKMDAYNFPEYRLKKKLDDPSKTPLLLVACGSFSPITFLHLRMFVMAADYVKFSTDFEIVGGYLSPVSDAYKKAGLATAEHR